MHLQQELADSLRKEATLAAELAESRAAIKQNIDWSAQQREALESQVCLYTGPAGP